MFIEAKYRLFTRDTACGVCKYTVGVTRGVSLAAAVLLLTLPRAAGAQTSAAPPPEERQPPREEAEAPPIRRWLDVQHLHLSSRFRWVENTEGRLTSSSVQWQPQLRARLLFDPAAKYALHVGVFSGSSFISGWNNTGAGIGAYDGTVNVKQLFVSAAPVRGVEAQVGGLYLMRGENTEITSYDNDGFIVGERLTYRPARGPVSLVALTTGHLGDIREPNVFNRLKRLDEWNYGQLLVGARLHDQVNVSADYTYEDTRDIFREGVMFRTPDGTPLVESVKLDLYQRVSPDADAGFNLATELRPAGPLTITVGVASIDPSYGGLNGDRYDFGTRAYSIGSYALTRDLSIGYFWGEAFANDVNVPLETRWEILLTINPTATLKRKRVF